MKIVILDKCTLTNGDVSLAPIASLGEAEYYDVLKGGALIDACRGAEAILCNRSVISREVIEAAPKLRYVGLFATGFNNVDLEAASEHSVTVTNVPDYSSDAVAQMTFSLILALASSTAAYDRFTHDCRWSYDTQNYFPFPITELNGKTLGIIGFGNIGKKVARIAEAFGMDVAVFTRKVPEGCPYRFVSFDRLMSESDFVSVHCPLNSSTKGMIGADAFARMKKSAYFINTARGAVADESALAEALNRGMIAGAAVDVAANEPAGKGSPLLTAKNLILTPHIAWAALETRIRLISLVAENLRAFLSGSPINRVN